MLKRWTLSKSRGQQSVAASTPQPADALTLFRRKPGLDLSLTGLIYCSMMLFMGAAAVNGQANLLFGVFGLMIGTLLISGVICRLVISRLKIERQLPEYFVVGRPATITYQFKNRKRFWPSLSVTMAELEGTEAFETQPISYMLHAAAKMTASVPVELVPKRRGAHTLGLYQLSTSFPFGFLKRALERRQPDTILVCPAVGHVSDKLLAMCRSAEKTGAPMKPRRGGQDEFYGVKEYRSGENPRRIYWRRSARTPGVLVSKEMTQVAPPRLMLLVDTFLPGPTTVDRAAVEKTIAMAGSLASSALEEGMAVGVCAWDHGEWSVLSIQRGKRHRRDVLALLARLPRNTASNTAALMRTARSLIKGGTTAMLFTPGDLQLGLTDQVRGSFVVVPALSTMAGAWFKFDSSVDFTRCSPIEEMREADAVKQIVPARLEPLNV